jgi:parvulin-like peptidyl-prolyl isomerase
MRDAILGEKMIHEYVSQKYSEAQLRKLYDENKSLFIKPPMVKVLHIFRNLSGYETKDELKQIEKEMEQIRKKALRGEDFRQLARGSDGLASTRGGDLGWLTNTNRLPEPINALIFKVKPGKISKVTLDDKKLGYHLIKVEDKKPISGTTFEEARQDVEAFVFNQTKQALIEQLKQKHRVIINLGGIPEHIAFPVK